MTSKQKKAADQHISRLKSLRGQPGRRITLPYWPTAVSPTRNAGPEEPGAGCRAPGAGRREKDGRAGDQPVQPVGKVWAASVEVGSGQHTWDECPPCLARSRRAGRRTAFGVATSQVIRKAALSLWPRQPTLSEATV